MSELQREKFAKARITHKDQTGATLALDIAQRFAEKAKGIQVGKGYVSFILHSTNFKAVQDELEKKNPSNQHAQLTLEAP